MLRLLSIRNFVVVEALDIEVAPGFTVLTGETGAGKSILLDALGLVLGLRADSGLVRAGEEQASVTATFEFSELPEAIGAALREAEVELEPGEPLILRRRVRADGGSKAWVNDQPVGGPHAIFSRKMGLWTVLWKNLLTDIWPYDDTGKGQKVGGP